MSAASVRVHPFTVLAAMLLAQVAVAMAVMTVPVLAPQIAVHLDVETSRIGLYSAIVFAGAITLTSIAGPVVARYGSVRTTQIALLLCGTGMALTVTGWLPAVVIGGFAAGMGYGVATPAASHLLARRTPARHRGLAFSVKQTGVPAGGLLLGLTIPVIAARFDWDWAVASLIVVFALAVVVIQPLRAVHDIDRQAGYRIGPGETAVAIRLVLSDPGLRPLAYASFVYAWMQLSLFSFYVVVLVERAGLDPVTAGATFSVMHAGGMFGRPVLGWVSDRILPARPLLALTGFGIFALSIALVALDASWPQSLIWLLSLLAGLVAAGWNGVYISEIARIMPTELVGRATGGVSAFTFLGVATGPMVFSAIIAASGSYTAAFLVMGGIALGPAILLLRAPGRRDVT